MSALRRFFAIAAASLLFISALGLSGAVDSAWAATGKVKVTIIAPAGIPATVALTRKAGSYAATKPATGTLTTQSLAVRTGTYRIAAKSMVIDGRYYTAEASVRKVRIRVGRTAKVTVTYRVQTAVKDFHVTSVAASRVELTWTAAPKTTIVIRRTTGTVPAASRKRGINVPVSGGKAVDQGLKAGKTYSYALFGKRSGRWIGPITLRVGTTSTDPTKATYVANPLTRLLKTSQVAKTATTGSGVVTTLDSGAAPPVIGAAVVLPPSAAIPGGYLGLVSSISADGRTVTLTPGSVDDAFDYYKLTVTSFEGGDSAETVTSKKDGKPLRVKDRKPLNADGSESPPAAKKAGVPALLTKCLGGGASREISMAAGFKTAGHFNAEIDKYNFLGKDIPTGASFDMAVAITASGSATVKTQGNVNCNLTPTPYVIPLSTAPIPINAVVTPTVAFSVNGQMEISNIGLAATAGVEIKGHFGLTNGASFSAKPILSATPLTPSITQSGYLGFKMGAQLIIGPGAGTPAAGVVAGVSGEFNPIDATFGAVFPANDPRFNACLKADAAFTRGLGLTAKAWLGNWDVSKTITLDALQGRTEYGGSPWYFPSGCKEAVDPGDDVIGDGVTLIEDEVTGGDQQYGKVPGLVPGSNTWVLSTGNIADAVGEPSTFASTNQGGSGDADLDTLATRPTYDAVAYTATVVPTGSTLHVRYVFASEEYPEYVGSDYNDVMAVYVDGKNCATVPGTNTPVSVNTINAGENASYFVDNATGASGYGTTMDGLTVPLECAVPVEIGKPVTVRIAVADASDRVYDSAVAVLDQGIWSN